MHLSILASLVILALRSASAQSLAGIPSCAQAAALAGIQTTGCPSTDIGCICKATAFLTGLQSALTSLCSEADQQTTISFAISLCDSVGQSISAPAPSEVLATDSSEIPVPTETSAPLDTEIVTFADGAPIETTEAPSETAPAEVESISFPEYSSGPTATTATVTTIPESDSASQTVYSYLSSSVPESTSSYTTPTSPPKNTTGNNSTVSLNQPIPFQGRATSLNTEKAWIGACAGLAAAAGLAFSL